MARKLRAGSGTNGLVLANGGVLTYQHVICLSSRPRAENRPYPARNPLPSTLSNDLVPETEESAEGDAIIEVNYPHCHFDVLHTLIISRRIQSILTARMSLCSAML